MARDSTGYTIGFAVAVCVLCGIGVAGAAVALAPRQAENKVLDQQKQVLLVAGLMKPGQQVSPDEVTSLFTKNIRREVINLKTGAEFDQSYDVLVLSPGAAPVKPPIPGIDDQAILPLRTVSDVDAIKAYLQEAYDASLQTSETRSVASRVAAMFQ